MNRRRWHDADDHEPAAAPDNELPLFSPAAAPAAPWPQAAPAGDEQLVAPIAGTIQARYEAWRRTELGERVFTEFLRRAIAEAQAGEDRISHAGIWEDIRKEWKENLNNSFRALIAREAEQLAPLLQGRFELRIRKAS